MLLQQIGVALFVAAPVTMFVGIGLMAWCFVQRRVGSVAAVRMLLVGPALGFLGAAVFVLGLPFDPLISGIAALAFSAQSVWLARYALRARIVAPRY